jgi:hypothetical protein
MEIVILPDTDSIGSLAADAIMNLLQRKPNAVLGLATGSSPLAIYEQLTARCADGRVSFAKASGFTLDEYVGLPADHPESYRNVIDKDFVSRVDFAPGAVQGPDGLADDIPASCAAYEAAIAAAGGWHSSPYECTIESFSRTNPDRSLRNVNAPKAGQKRSQGTADLPPAKILVIFCRQARTTYGFPTA